jgi:hypothetical protein
LHARRRTSAAGVTRCFEDPEMAVARFPPSIPDNLRFIGARNKRTESSAPRTDPAIEQYEAEIAKISAGE